MSKITGLQNKVLRAFKPYSNEKIMFDESLTPPIGSRELWAGIRPCGWDLRITHRYRHTPFYDVDIRCADGVTENAYLALTALVSPLTPRTVRQVGAVLYCHGPPRLELLQLESQTFYAALPHIAKALVQIGTIVQKHQGAMTQDLDALLAEHKKSKQ